MTLMRKAVVGALVALAVVVTALVLGPTIWAQVREGRRVSPGVDRLMLLGPGPETWLGAGSEIGVSVRELRADEVAAAKLEQQGGVYVQDVREGTPASRAGLRNGDIIASFDGERVRGVRHFSRLVLETPPDRAVSAVIVRGTERQTIQVTPEAGRFGAYFPDVGREIGREIERGMRAIPRDFDFDFDFEFPDRISRGRLGVSLTPLGDQLATYFGVKEGALVSSVEPDSPAAQAGIKAGDVITAVNGRTVANVGDVMTAVREAAPGAAIDIRVVRNKKEMTLKVTIQRVQRTGPALPV